MKILHDFCHERIPTTFFTNLRNGERPLGIGRLHKITNGDESLGVFMNKFIELYVHLTTSEQETLMKKYGDQLALKFFLSRSLDKIIEKECEDIKTSLPVDGVHFDSNQSDDSSEKEIA